MYPHFDGLDARADHFHHVGDQDGSVAYDAVPLAQDVQTERCNTPFHQASLFDDGNVLPPTNEPPKINVPVVSSSPLGVKRCIIPSDADATLRHMVKVFARELKPVEPRVHRFDKEHRLHFVTLEKSISFQFLSKFHPKIPETILSQNNDFAVLDHSLSFPHTRRDLVETAA
jgi:hypothetical protein